MVAMFSVADTKDRKTLNHVSPRKRPAKAPSAEEVGYEVPEIVPSYQSVAENYYVQKDDGSEAACQISDEPPTRYTAVQRYMAPASSGHYVKLVYM